MENINFKDLILKHGKGVFLFTDDDTELLDLTSGATVMNLGHGNERLAGVISEQALSLVNSYAFGHPVRRIYEQKLLQALNCNVTDAYDGLYFVTTGSEAIDTALRLAWVTTKKKNIISTPTSYHGRTLAGHYLTQLSFRRSAGMPQHPDFVFTSYPTDGQGESEHIRQLETVLTSTRDVAALILEPYQGDGGMVFPSSSFFQEVEQLCRRYGVLLILDEIQSGFGRTGDMFAFQGLKITPDIICLGKAIANGIPCSVVVTRAGLGHGNLIEKDFFSSFGANPLALATANEVLNIFNEHCIIEHVRVEGEYLLALLQELPVKYSLVRSVQGRGMIFGIHLAPAPIDNQSIGNVFFRVALENKLLVMPPKGPFENVIKISPPLIISRCEIDIMVKRLQSTLEQVQALLL